MEKNKEIRFNPINYRIGLNEDGTESRTIEGTAIVFNSQSELLSEDGLRFYETIAPEAVTPELLNKSDIVFLFNHKKDAGVLARSKKGTGTLSINITNEGVDFSFEAPKSAIGDNVLESVKRGDLDACSFAFCIKQGGDLWTKIGDVYQRTIKVIDSLHDFSIVINPAYTATSVNARGLKEAIEADKVESERLKAEEIEAQRLKDIEVLEQRKLDIKNYYDNLFKK